jgi:hypothetical protein
MESKVFGVMSLLENTEERDEVKEGLLLIPMIQHFGKQQ